MTSADDQRHRPVAACIDGREELGPVVTGEHEERPDDLERDVDPTGGQGQARSQQAADDEHEGIGWTAWTRLGGDDGRPAPLPSAAAAESCAATPPRRRQTE